MNGNAAFIIILIIVYVFSVYGKHQGLFRGLVPVLTIFSSVFLLALVLPDFAERLAADAGKLDIRETVFDVAAFAVTFLILRFVFKIVLRLIEPVLDFPVICDIDRTLGLLVGFCTGIIVVWLGFFLGLFLLGREGMEPLFKMMESSAPLKFIYNHNLLMTFIHKVVFG